MSDALLSHWDESRPWMRVAWALSSSKRMLNRMFYSKQYFSTCRIKWLKNQSWKMACVSRRLRLLFHITEREPVAIFFFPRLSFLFFSLFYFTILYWFCHTLAWIHHGCTCVPNPEPGSHLPPHTISLGHPSAPAPTILYPASNLDWKFISYMILYIFECHSPKSSYTRPLPQSPKDSSIYLCLFCCLAYRVIITIFLNSIYMC